MKQQLRYMMALRESCGATPFTTDKVKSLLPMTMLPSYTHCSLAPWDWKLAGCKAIIQRSELNSRSWWAGYSLYQGCRQLCAWGCWSTLKVFQLTAWLQNGAFGLNSGDYELRMTWHCLPTIEGDSGSLRTGPWVKVHHMRAIELVLTLNTIAIRLVMWPRLWPYSSCTKILGWLRRWWKRLAETVSLLYEASNDDSKANCPGARRTVVRDERYSGK